MTINLIKAAARNDRQAVVSEISNGANVNFRDSEHGNTALLCALKRGHLAMAKFLIKQHNADPFISDKLGFNAYDVCDGSYERFIRDNDGYFDYEDEDKKSTTTDQTQQGSSLKFVGEIY